jgi:16S rRNA (guanine527-N7)-methyltransferase
MSRPLQQPAAPSGAAALFGDRLPLAEAFVAILADTGVSRGLLGPREVPRLWERHVLNCAVIADAFPPGATIIDVGSGAGLPGVALAIVRPDLTLHLVEPMQRRVTWLEETTRVLGLTSVTVHRARAEELAGRLVAPWVTARAVARLATLARWCRPLLADQGRVVAMKGASAATELDEDRAQLDALGLISAEVTEYGAGLVEPPTTAVELSFGPAVPTAGEPRRGPAGTGRGGRRNARRRRA